MRIFFVQLVVNLNPKETGLFQVLKRLGWGAPIQISTPPPPRHFLFKQYTSIVS